MRLRALHLGNVRKFAGQRASITGIGDGITVVSEANEFGKSTFFDALHALFFDKYSSAAKQVKSLQPYAKGGVEIAAEIETDAGTFRVEKTFLKSGGAARILRLPAETVLAQDDEAERWLLDVLGSDKNGPAGLLWVRQGVTGLEAEGKTETLKQLETRRDLLSSVSGEIDTMTGGRRMDRVMKRVAEELKGLVTATGKPTGAWRTLISDIADMEQNLSALDAQINKLSAALTGRKDAETQLATLDLAEAKAARAQALSLAQDAFAEAKAHAGRIERAEQSHRLAQIEAQAARGRLDRFLSATEALTVARGTAEKTGEAAAQATVESTRLDAVLAEARAAKSHTEAEVAKAQADQEAARAQLAARAALARSDDLKKQLQQIEEAQKRRDAAAAYAKASPATPEWLSQVEQAENAVAVQSAAVALRSASLRISYSGEARITRDGAPLPGEEDVALRGPTKLTIPGIGTVVLQVPDAGDADLAQSERARDALLASAAVGSVQEARELAARRARAVQERETGDAILKTLAPNGTEKLRAEKASADLAAEGADTAPMPAPEVLETALSQARAADSTAQAALERSEAAAAAAREAAIRAQAAEQGAKLAVQKAEAEAGPEEGRDTLRTDLIRAEAQAAEALTDTARTLADLRAQAPDLVTAKAELTRAQEAQSAADGQMQTLRVRIAALSAEIHALAEAGVEETRDTLAGELETARAQGARFASKAAALTRLQSALEAERTAAQDTYFGPVQEELKPLLSIVYDDAGLQFDSDSLLPAGLSREQTEERLDHLSGGTQEQIAILTRLAFARLFRGQGRHMPIVLDDALVYSDDGRIMKMFTALTRVAEDQQILVFTCRTLAFLQLGGTRPEVTIRDL
ncbi:AAA family ATPase [Gymnodinialimonas sp.]